ncbi:S41 family peptidase [Flavobacterium humi]|uniref:S41 family peptidase n=1 Tax=Flavobacterium humi TaxID=2562683 RepID=A0A4Z0L7E7_9FLAO|nr:S41 family peptidase [Flavobacterium humi]TGD57699.1 S41 family peptidase [Flavobacterium humi]
MKVDKVYFPLIIFTAVAVGFLLGGIFIKAPVSEKQNAENQTKRKLNKLIDFIDSDYVDEVNTDSIVDQTVNGILEKLDPHSVYIAKNEAEEAAQSMKGNFVGIGVNFFIDKDTVAVIQPIEGGPSEKAGIKAGDRILSANGAILFGKKITTEKLYSKLKGEPNSEVTLLIFRKSENKKFKVKVIRNVVPVKSVDIAIMLNKTTGYIKINRFAETTYNEFKSGLNRLIKQGAKSLVLDLRNNGGGYLEEAVFISDEFLKDDKLIVFTKNRKGRIDKTFASDKGAFENGKLTVLINENTASASEIIAGAIQDNDRGLIIGRRSFGKGLVQREMLFDDKSTVRLTVARYYTPTGRSIQKSYKEGNAEYFNDFMHRYESGELYAKDSIKIADTLKFKTPKGRIVYGGGGIVPDIFVPIETAKGNEIIPLLMQSGAVTNFVFTELDANRRAFKGMTIQQISAKIETSDVYFNDFKNFINTSESFIDLDSNKNYVKRYLTAEFCRQLLGENQYYQIVLKDDTMVKEALKH